MLRIPTFHEYIIKQMYDIDVLFESLAYSKCNPINLKCDNLVNFVEESIFCKCIIQRLYTI